MRREKNWPRPNNKPYIVLHYGGKREECDWIAIYLFYSLQEAEYFCLRHTDEEFEKYWEAAYIIEEGVECEPMRYEL